MSLLDALHATWVPASVSADLARYLVGGFAVDVEG